MSDIAVSGIAAKEKFIPRRDRWRRIEEYANENDHKEKLVFCFFPPLSFSTKHSASRTEAIRQEMEAYKKPITKFERGRSVVFPTVNTSNSKNRKTVKNKAKSNKSTAKCLPPVQVVRRGVGYYQHTTATV